MKRDQANGGVTANTAFIRVKVETRDKLLRMAREDKTSVGKLLETAIETQYHRRSVKEKSEAKSVIDPNEVEEYR